MGTSRGYNRSLNAGLILASALIGALAWGIDGLNVGMWAGFFLMVLLKMRK